MKVHELIKLLNHVSNKEADCFMWAYTENTDEYLSINSVNVEHGDGDIVLSPIDTHKTNDVTFTSGWDKGFQVG